MELRRVLFRSVVPVGDAVLVLLPHGVGRRRDDQIDAPVFDVLQDVQTISWIDSVLRQHETAPIGDGCRWPIATCIPHRAGGVVRLRKPALDEWEGMWRKGSAIRG